MNRNVDMYFKLFSSWLLHCNIFWFCVKLHSHKNHNDNILIMKKFLISSHLCKTSSFSHTGTLVQGNDHIRIYNLSMMIIICSYTPVYILWLLIIMKWNFDLELTMSTETGLNLMHIWQVCQFSLLDYVTHCQSSPNNMMQKIATNRRSIQWAMPHMCSTKLFCFHSCKPWIVILAKISMHCDGSI